MIRFLTIAFILICQFTFGQEKTTILFAHADWCIYCDKMLEETFSEDVLTKIEALEINYIEYNIETEDTICINDNCYAYIPSGVSKSYHEVTTTFFGENETLPAIAFLLPNGEILTHHGYLSEEELLLILNALPNEKK